MSGQLHTSAALAPGKNPRYPGGWMGPTDGLDASEKSRISYTVGIRNPDRPARILVTIPTELHWRLNFLPVLDSVRLR
jgi:hypothetical protein